MKVNKLLKLIFIHSIFILAIFSLKKSLKEYQKRLLVLGNATYNDQTAVC
jgi:hypothetical protein